MFAIDHGNQIGLGDIDVDCKIVDLREKKSRIGATMEMFEKVKLLKESGLTYREVAQEVGVSCQTVYNWIKKYEKEKNTATGERTDEKALR